MDESLLNESFADAGLFAGFDSTLAGSLSVFRSLLAEPLAGAGVAAAGSMLACGSLAAESFAAAGSSELPLGGSPSGELSWDWWRRTQSLPRNQSPGRVIHRIC